VDVAGETTSAIYEPAAGAQDAVFVCAHGAGGNVRDRGVQRVAETLRAVGIGVVRFNFLYKERGSGRPDPMPKLMTCVAAVIERARRELSPETLLIGGRSMGGRAASMLAADGYDADGLLLLAYPLHPPGRHDKLRDAHLPSITMPVLCFNGTRDTFCEPDLMNAALRTVTAPWTMHWIEGADHSFHVPKASGRTDADVFDDIGATTRAWLDHVAG
jgi:predicted alpha/beta-hydrolase family hydrolase